MPGGRSLPNVSPGSSPSTSRRALLGGSAALAAGLAGCSRLSSDSPSLSAASPDGWPQRFCDPGNTNAAPEAPDSLTERWSLRVDARLDRPLVVDGAVVTVANPHDRSEPVQVLTVDAAAGERRGAVDLEGVHRARIAAADTDRRYVVGERVEEADGERLYAVGREGEVAWTFDAERIAAVTAAGATVLVAVGRGPVVALDAETGSSVDRLHPSRWPGGRLLSDRVSAGRPAVLGERAFAPFAKYDRDREDAYFGEELVAFDADGVAWREPIEDVCYVEDVTAVGDTVYALSEERCPGGVDSPRARLTAFDPDSGERRWTRSIEGGVFAPAAADADGITVVGGEARTYGADGERRARGPSLSGPPVVAGGVVYGRRTDGEFVDTVVAADRESGERLGSHTFEYQLNRAPVFAGGRAIARTLEYERTDEGADHVADRLHALW